MTSLLVTGASGFIGSHLVTAARAAGFEVTAADASAGDVADAATWSRLPVADVIVHLAARSFVPDSWIRPADFLQTNVLGATHALEQARKTGARVVFLSSYMYGNPARLPIPETDPLVTPNPYALSKKIAEDLCAFYATAFKVPTTILRVFNVYGPRQGENFLVPFVIRQAIAGGEIVVKDLEPKRDYVYIRDVVAAILKAVEHRGTLEVFNIGSGTSHSVAELIEAVQRTWSTHATVRSLGERRRDEIMDTVADIGAARRKLGWSPEWDLERGLADLKAQSA